MDDLDGLEEDTDTGDDGADAGSDDGDADDAPPPKESKRVSDLTSKWQKAEARAKKAEAALAKSRKQPASDDQADDARGAEAQEWIEAQREFARERAFTSDARLAEYGLTSEDITGDTPGAMRDGVKRYVALIDAIETKVRNRVLADHGLTPDTPGGGKEERLDFASMSDEDFEKQVRRAKSHL